MYIDVGYLIWLISNEFQILVAVSSASAGAMRVFIPDTSASILVL